MRKLITEYCDVHNLDVDLMQCEVVSILDPSEHSRLQCEKILSALQLSNR